MTSARTNVMAAGGHSVGRGIIVSDAVATWLMRGISGAFWAGTSTELTQPKVAMTHGQINRKFVLWLVNADVCMAVFGLGNRF